MTSTLSCAPLTLTSPPMYGEHVEALQIGLKSFKYDFGPIDGIYGPLTAGAVELYKADIGYNPVDPTVDLTIYHKLGVRCLTENTEPLIYNNPLAQLVEVVWFNGVKHWIQILEENMNIDPSKTKVAKIFRPVYFVNDQGGAKDFRIHFQ
jgi:peptidoglycan hydrolase-like protein with peptidoglycan-binding domain